MAAYRATVDELAKCFDGYEVKHVPRAENCVADELSRFGSARKPVPPDVFLEHLDTPSVIGVNSDRPTESNSALAVMTVSPTSTTPYLAYLAKGDLPDDEVLRR